MARTAFNQAGRRGRRLASRALTWRQRVDAHIEPTAVRLGWLGLLVLIGCGALHLMPSALGPLGLTPRAVLLITVVALVASSFLGWAAVRRGQERLRRHVSRPLGMLLFAALPVCCALLLLIDQYILGLTWLLPSGHALWSVIHWYVPGLAALSLAAYLWWRSRSGRSLRSRDFGWALVIALPYALVCAVVVFGVAIPGVDASLRHALAMLGEWAIVMQLTLAWFVGGSTR